MQAATSADLAATLGQKALFRWRECMCDELSSALERRIVATLH